SVARGVHEEPGGTPGGAHDRGSGGLRALARLSGRGGAAGRAAAPAVVATERAPGGGGFLRDALWPSSAVRQCLRGGCAGGRRPARTSSAQARPGAHRRGTGWLGGGL